MKIIDWDRKGNVVRFYLGEDNLKEWWGDDWDDAPYEHNAGTVYSKYASGIIDIAFPYDWSVFEPADDWSYKGNSPYSKEDFMNKNAPFLVVVSSERVADSWRSYSFWTGAIGDGVYKLYFGDNADCLLDNNFHVIKKEEWDWTGRT